MSIPLPVPLAISPEATRKLNDAGVRRNILGRMHGQNLALQIIRGNYGGWPDFSGGGGGDGGLQPPAAGASNTFEYMFDSATLQPPSGNEIRFNNSMMGLVTAVWIMNLSAVGRDNSNFFAVVGAGQRIFVQDKDNGAMWEGFDVTGPTINKGTYTEFPVTHRASGSAALAQQRVLVNIGPPQTTGAKNAFTVARPKSPAFEPGDELPEPD